MAQRFGCYLRRLRKKAGLSQKAVAGFALVHPSYISQIEAGTVNPPSDAIQRQLAAVLGTTYADLAILSRIDRRKRRRRASSTGAESCPGSSDGYGNTE